MDALRQRWAKQLDGRRVLLGVDGLDATKVAPRPIHVHTYESDSLLSCPDTGMTDADDAVYFHALCRVSCTSSSPLRRCSTETPSLQLQSVSSR